MYVVIPYALSLFLILSTFFFLGREMFVAFVGVMEGEASDLPADLAALEPLVEVKKHRSRIKCALLPWHALADAEGAGG